MELVLILGYTYALHSFFSTFRIKGRYVDNVTSVIIIATYLAFQIVKLIS